jgi:predicted acetyltransferase
MNTSGDAINIRHPAEQDWQAVYEHQARTYGDPVDARSAEAWKRRVELEDILIAEDVSDPQRPFLVGTSIIYRTHLAVPGGVSLRAAWLTMITVASTHQGRGVWAELSAKGLGILIERGYPIVCGVPTQTAMYDGFGAGVASYSQALSIDRRFAKLREEPTGNRAREVTAAEAKHHVPEIYERWRAATSGAVERDSAWWDASLEDRPTQRRDGSVLNCTIHPDGFLSYRLIGETTHEYRPPFGTVVVEDFCAITEEAHTELLQTLLALEMFNEVRVELPTDDPLPLKLTDQRAAEITGKSDWLWARINDVPEVLGARTYNADTELVLDVEDPLGLSGGTFQLRTHDGAGKCTPHDGPADIKIGLAELMTVFMGAHRAPELARAHRITELRSGSLANLDAAFGAERAPYCGTLF